MMGWEFFFFYLQYEWKKKIGGEVEGLKCRYICVYISISVGLRVFFFFLFRV